MILPNNVKHLVIIIPNEIHESLNQPKDQYPFINQAYLPQSAVVRLGTMVVWFNGDVDHDHKITLTNNLSPGNIFKDLRGGQSGTGDEQTLVVWTSAGKNIDEITSKLQRDINGFYNIHKLTPL
jgi:hypothetical protein